jgi:hypothetical protein
MSGRTIVWRRETGTRSNLHNAEVPCDVRLPAISHRTPDSTGWVGADQNLDTEGV